MSRARQAATKSQQMLLKGTFQKQNPNASELQLLPGGEDMETSLAPPGSTFTIPLTANYSSATLPEKTWGATAAFCLDSSFSEFDLRRAESTISGKLVSDFASRLGQGPDFVCTNDKSDVMHLNCLPERMGHDTVDWQPFLGQGTVKIVQQPNSIDSMLVVDVPHLPNASQAYENVFKVSAKKPPMSAVAVHPINDLLDRTAIRNACKVAQQFAAVSGIKFKTYHSDYFSTNPEKTQLPTPFAVSVDRPFIFTKKEDKAVVRVSSGMRMVSSIVPTRLVASPSKTVTLIADSPSLSSESMPAYFNRSRASAVINNSLSSWYKERVFHVGKAERPTADILQSIVPQVDEDPYQAYIKKSCVNSLAKLQTVALFKV